MLPMLSDLRNFQQHTVSFMSLNLMSQSLNQSLEFGMKLSDDLNGINVEMDMYLQYFLTLIGSLLHVAIESNLCVAFFRHPNILSKSQ